MGCDDNNVHCRNCGGLLGYDLLPHSCPAPSEPEPAKEQECAHEGRCPACGEYVEDVRKCCAEEKAAPPHGDAEKESIVCDKPGCKLNRQVRDRLLVRLQQAQADLLTARRERDNAEGFRRGNRALFVQEQQLRRQAEATLAERTRALEEARARVAELPELAGCYTCGKKATHRAEFYFCPDHGAPAICIHLLARAEQAESALAALREELSGAYREAMQREMAIAEGKPLENGEYPHLGICSAGRKHPLGSPGCVCAHRERKLRADLSDLREKVGELLGQIQGSPKLSIGSIENVYEARFDVQQIAKLRTILTKEGER